jgi:signal transduction histidine kinase
MTDRSIILETQLAEDLWRVCVDRNQAENAILNLLMNARDAMRDGGELTIVTRNAVDGENVVVEVSDTGEGMTAETRERIFEPFFTTKTLGRGSGLGLSQVYGFVTQSRGNVEIDSNPGDGSTIRIALPRALEEEV